MTAPLTLKAYAERRGVSPMAVSKAVASGRLSASVGRNERDQPTILDPELADREWEQNTRQRAGRQPTHPGPAPEPGQPVRVFTIPPPPDPRGGWLSIPVAERVDGAPAAADFGPPLEQISRFGEVLDPDADPRPRFPDADAPIPRARRPDLPEGVPVYHVSQAIRAHHAARAAAAAADQAELDLAARRGRLVDADAARADVEKAYNLVKTRLLRVPSDLAQRLPHLAAEVVPVLEELQRQALEELAGPGSPGLSP